MLKWDNSEEANKADKNGARSTPMNHVHDTATDRDKKREGEKLFKIDHSEISFNIKNFSRLTLL